MPRIALLAALAGALAAGQNADTVTLAPYFPTPHAIVERMLQFGALKPGEKMFDLGSGDGRIVIMAAERFQADATGVEFNEALHRQSAVEIQRRKLGKSARIILGDVYKQDYSSADLITVYLLPDSNTKMRPLLEKQLKKGARIVSHDFEFAGWKPEKTEHLEDTEGRSHTIYLYRR